jgi:hypothetical protein
MLCLAKVSTYAMGCAACLAKVSTYAIDWLALLRIIFNVYRNEQFHLISNDLLNG